MDVDVVILAGRRNSGKIAPPAEAAWEALIPVAGQPLVRWVAAAVTATAGVRRTVVVGPVAELGTALGDLPVEVVPPGADVLDSALAGAARLNGERPILFCTGDIPMIRAEDLERFLAACDREPGDVFYAVVDRAVAEAAYPGVRRTWVRLADGTVTGGNLLLIRSAVLGSSAGRARALLAARKKPWRLASLVGWGILVRFLLGSLTLAGAAERVSAVFGVRGVVVRAVDAAIGVDVDKPADLALARRVLS